ncbi:hypothetical protein [Burkholderia arboris]|nr:hypothetical protein [Burkholderia arboris]MCA8493652.1 hypothetical protein [Burkholderia arboris]UTV59946.1 hypothetical protein NLX30_37820 [Burkholderia arboris]
MFAQTGVQAHWNTPLDAHFEKTDAAMRGTLELPGKPPGPYPVRFIDVIPTF